MAKPKIYADFHNADKQGRLRLNCVGTLEDLARQQVQLSDGLRLTLFSEDRDVHGQPSELQAEGIVAYAPDEKCWVAVIDWEAIRQVPAEAGQLGRVGRTP